MRKTLKHSWQCPFEHTHSFKDRHGVARHYYRRNGMQTTLPKGDWHAPDFLRAFEKARNDYERGQLPITTPAQLLEQPHKGSFAWGVQDLFQTTAFKDLELRTKKEARRILETIIHERCSTNPDHPSYNIRFGQYMMRDMDAPLFTKLLKRKEEYRAEANHWREWCSKVMANAAANGLGGVKANPLREISMRKPTHAWIGRAALEGWW
jgi:hypothetical protein